MGIWPCSMASSGYLIVSKIMAIIQAEITAGQNPHLDVYKRQLPGAVITSKPLSTSAGP